MIRMMIITEIISAVSLTSREKCSRVPTDCLPMMTRSSPAIRLRQANAQPCLSPATNDGSEAGMIRCR
ncbi:hypothetical protein GCM10010439_19610 [Actinocorallia aurantiaca]|uniref:Uncharacterized protein n=1 Tax=Actinocorallia aurantiaca TaxID=46204 RepID=A0ABN3U3M5_9ACTN